MSGEDGPPEAIVEEIVSLTRQCRSTAEDELLSRRDELLELIGYELRIREDADDESVVLYPSSWVRDGTVDPERIDDVSVGVERPLSSPASPDDWAAVERENRAVVETVTERHGPVHGSNASALADFMGNHYTRPIAACTDRHRQEFLEEYYPRNVWPSADERAVVEESLEVTVDVAREVSSGSQ